jgi:hypothetical protein
MTSLKIVNQLLDCFKGSKLNISGHVSFVITKWHIFEVFDSNRGTHINVSRFENNSGSLIQKMLVSNSSIDISKIIKLVEPC